MTLRGRRSGVRDECIMRLTTCTTELVRIGIMGLSACKAVRGEGITRLTVMVLTKKKKKELEFIGKRCQDGFLRMTGTIFE